MKATSKTGRRLLALLVSLACLGTLLAVPAFAAGNPELMYTEGTASYTSWSYVHDPRLNPSAMEDIVVDPTAVYGFAPSPEGSLKQFADVDWSDPALVNGENGRLARIKHHRSLQSMYSMMAEMTAAGCSTEEIARAVSTRRNEIRLESYADNPEGLAMAKARNLEKYGHEEGPLPDELYAQYGSWEIVLDKAFSTNSGMDACLGLYDDYYDLYVAVGHLEAEETAPATREYAVAAFIDSVEVDRPDDGPALSDFTDAGQVSPWYQEELEEAASAGILKGYPDGTVKPKDTILRIEALVLFSRCIPELPEVQAPIEFSDVPDWASADIDRLSSAGLVEGYGDGTLGSYDNLTVEQVMILTERLYRMGVMNACHDATEEDQAVFEALIAANSIEQVLARHNSVYIEQAFYQAGEYVSGEQLYTDADTFVSAYDDGYIYLLTRDVCVSNCYDAQYMYDPAATDSIAEWLLDGQDYGNELAAGQSALSTTVGEAETLYSAALYRGVWQITTAIEDPDQVRAELQRLRFITGTENEYQDGMAILYGYAFQAGNGDLLHISCYLSGPEGEMSLLGGGDVYYDRVLDPALTPLASFFASEDFRSVSVVFDMGTETEHTETYAVPRGFFFDVKQAGIWGVLYTDPQLTQVYDYDSSATDDNVTVYFVPDSVE